MFMSLPLLFDILFSKLTLITLFIISVSIQPVHAQIEKSSELFVTLAKKDSMLFDEGFNRCNLQMTEDLISIELEFYHDTGGIQNRNEFFKAIKENICSDPDNKPIRKLVEGSLEVFPLEDNGTLYGAIQRGIHQFYIREPGKNVYLTSSADFTHLWILDDGDWKLKTVLSYNHQVPN